MIKNLDRSYHIPSIKKTSKNVYINVGSIALPKENSPKTYAVLDEQGITIYSIDNDVVLTYWLSFLTIFFNFYSFLTIILWKYKKGDIN